MIVNNKNRQFELVENWCPTQGRINILQDYSNLVGLHFFSLRFCPFSIILSSFFFHLSSFFFLLKKKNIRASLVKILSANQFELIEKKRRRPEAVAELRRSYEKQKTLHFSMKGF